MFVFAMQTFPQRCLKSCYICRRMKLLCYYFQSQHHGIKWREKNIPIATTAITKGVRNPHIPTQDRTSKNDPITPHTVIIGITLGQYAPQNSRDDADTLNVGLLGNLHGRYIVK
mmetsp:Transcript_20006/g.34091  ORF Transcript_20006/g.34091 Transcript_20006/m.34091 type:complete len:114 (+) Transcript_20006:106-447(+)